MTNHGGTKSTEGTRIVGKVTLRFVKRNVCMIRVPARARYVNVSCLDEAAEIHITRPPGGRTAIGFQVNPGDTLRIETMVLKKLYVRAIQRPSYVSCTFFF